MDQFIGALHRDAQGAGSTTVVAFDGHLADSPKVDIGAERAPVSKSDRSRPDQVGTHRNPWRVLACVLLLALATVWVVFFRPQVLGGRVSYVEAITSTMAPTIPQGDLVAAKKQSSYQSGDIIVYYDPGAARSDVGKMIISRIVGGNGVTGFVTKGDRSPGIGPFHPQVADVVGKVWFHFGRTLLLPFTLAFAVVLVVLVVVARPGTRQRP